MLTVIINKTHLGGNYVDGYDCPLFRAVKEQHPDLPLDLVGGHGSLRIKGRHVYPEGTRDDLWTNDGKEASCWSHYKAIQIEKGEIDSVTLTYNI